MERKKRPTKVGRWVRRNRLVLSVSVVMLCVFAIAMLIPKYVLDGPKTGGYQEFLEALGRRESTNNYAAVNRFGYMGRYQMGGSALKEAGFKDENGAWTALAHSYGIYNDGLVSYIMNGVWYIYPRYGKPLHRHAIHVYCLGGNKYAGLPRMDYVEDTVLRGPTTFIISPSELEETNWTNLGSENEPTSIVSMLSDLVVDGSRHLISDTRADLNRITFQSTIVPPDTMDFENYIRIKHMQSHGNLFAINSRLRAQQGRSLKFSWEGARPWVFHPATIVSVHYDDHNKVGTAEGICEVADYVFTKDPRARMVPLWTCKGEFDVYCSVRDSSLDQSK